MTRLGRNCFAFGVGVLMAALMALAMG